MGISLSQGRYLHTHKKNRINAHNTVIHAFSGIRTHDPSASVARHMRCPAAGAGRTIQAATSGRSVEFVLPETNTCCHLSVQSVTIIIKILFSSTYFDGLCRLACSSFRINPKLSILQRVVRPIRTQNKRRYSYTTMHRVGFEPTGPLLCQTKTFCTLDRAATVIGNILLYWEKCRCYSEILCNEMIFTAWPLMQTVDNRICEAPLCGLGATEPRHVMGFHRTDVSEDAGWMKSSKDVRFAHQENSVLSSIPRMRWLLMYM
jgi:hypothetical protein